MESRGIVSQNESFFRVDIDAQLADQGWGHLELQYRPVQIPRARVAPAPIMSSVTGMAVP